MLFALGTVTFEVAPLNAVGMQRATETTYAEKPVIGRRPPLEFVGEGAETIRLSARVFPAKFGGLGDLEKLDDLRRAGKSLPLIRGDGAALGWFVIESMQEASSYLDARGIGRVIEVDLTLKRAEKASGQSILSLLSTLFR